MTQTPVGSTATITAQEPQALSATVSRQRLISILIGVLLGMLLSALDQTIVGTALPRIVSELGGLNQYAWVVTAYLLPRRSRFRSMASFPTSMAGVSSL